MLSISRMRPAVLIFSPFYLPGFKGGGPIRSIYNLCSSFGDSISFTILTRDRDLGDLRPYLASDIHMVKYNSTSDIIYLKPFPFSFFLLSTHLLSGRYTTLYLNSFFSFWFTIVPLILIQLFRPSSLDRVVLAPRGEFSPGALLSSSIKKKIYILLFKALFKLPCPFSWHATSLSESSHIYAVFGDSFPVCIAPNIPSPPQTHALLDISSLNPLRIVFASRICKKKNLSFAISTLNSVCFPVIFSIIGPIEDPLYWSFCLSLIAKLPANIEVKYLGPLPTTELNLFLRHQHLFYLPTLGENFGHVIYEALSNSVPVLISDQTPWNNVALRGAGWAYPLLNADLFSDQINTIANLPLDKFLSCRRNAHSSAKQYYSTINLSSYLSMLA